MRVLGTSMTILILAGIFSSTIAQRRIPIMRELIHRQSKFSYIPVSRSAALEFFGAELEDLDIFSRRKCEEIGRPTAYDGFRRNLMSLPDCIDFSLNIRQLESDRQHALYNREWRKFFEEYCPDFVAVKICFLNIIDSIMLCLKPEEREQVQIYDDVTNSILDFLCRADGRRIAHFVAIGGAECVATEQEALLVCVTEALERYSRPGEPRKFPSYDLSPEECADVEKLQNCTVRVTQTCNNPRIASVVESVFDFYKKLRSCEVIPEEPTTSTEEIRIYTTTPQVLVRLRDFLNTQMCDENGGPTAYETFKESAQLVFDAYGLVANSSQINAEMDNAPPGEELVNVCKKYCRRAPILKGLIKYAGDSMKHCLESKERNRVDLLYKIRSSILEFACQNESERISTFVATGGIECLGSEEGALLKCASQSFVGYSPSIFSVGAPALGLDNLEVPFVQGAKFCADVDRFRYCSIEMLEQCGDRTTIFNLLNSAVDLISREIPCGNLLEQTEPPAPEISNSTIAPEGFPSTEATLETPSDLDNITGLRDIPTMRIVSNKAFSHYLKEKCAPNYQPTKYEVARVMPDYLSESILYMLGNLELINFESIDVAGHDKLNVVFKEFCRNVSTVEERMQLVADSVETCPYVRDQVKMSFLHNTTSAFQEFICHNDGERLARFKANRGIELSAHKNISIDECLSEYSPNYVESTTSYVPFGMSMDACQYHSRMVKYCFTSLLGARRHPTPANIVDSLIDYVTRAVPCTGMVNPEGPGTPIS